MRHAAALVLALTLGAAAMLHAPAGNAAELAVGIGLPIGVYGPPVAPVAPVAYVPAPRPYWRPAPWWGVGRYYYGGAWGYPYHEHFFHGGYGFRDAYRGWHGGRR